MSLFDHSDLEKFVFKRKFNMTLAETGTLKTDARIQYIRTLFRGEVLFQFDLLFSHVENTENSNVDYYIKGLALYLPPVNSLSKQKRAMCR